MGSWKRNWGSRYDYDTLHTCMKVSENNFKSKKTNKRNDNVFSRIKSVSYFILLLLCGVFDGYCLFVHTLIFLLNSLLILCYFVVRI